MQKVPHHIKRRAFLSIFCSMFLMRVNCLFLQRRKNGNFCSVKKWSCTKKWSSTKKMFSNILNEKQRTLVFLDDEWGASAKMKVGFFFFTVPEERAAIKEEDSPSPSEGTRKKRKIRTFIAPFTRPRRQRRSRFPSLLRSCLLCKRAPAASPPRRAPRCPRRTRPSLSRRKR